MQNPVPTPPKFNPNPNEVLITLDVRTDYPHRLGVGELVYDRSGFLIGQITDSVVQS